MDESQGAAPLPAPVALEGRFFRHQAARWQELNGSRVGGRYSPPGEFGAIYLARPLVAVVGEAYRHLVDPYEIDPATLDPRVLFVVEVALRGVLDLREETARSAAGLSRGDLAGEHERCQAVGRRAFEADYQGVIAPAATSLGETLCVFAERVQPEGLRVLERRVWEVPGDPRRERRAG